MRSIIAQYKKFSFKFIGIGNVIRTKNKYLFHFRFNAQCRFTNFFIVDRNFSVSKYFQSEFFCAAVKYITTFFAQTDFFWKKQKANTISSKRRQVNSKLY